MLRVLIYVLLLAALIYSVIWAIGRRNQEPGAPRTTGTAPRGPVGPDDDEDFLRELDRKRRHQRPEEPG